MNKETAVEWFVKELFKKIDYIQVDPKLIEQAITMEKEQINKAVQEAVKFGAKWQAERMLAFINDEDNHTEGELGNSCIDVQTLVNFINQKTR